MPVAEAIRTFYPEAAIDQMASFEFVRAFISLRQEDAVDFGPKVAHLGEMTNIGFRVPPGLGVNIQAFDAMVSYNPEVARLIREEPRLKNNSERWLAHLEVLRTTIRAATMPPRVAQEIRQGIELLKLEEMAVRSSGLAEDSNADAGAGLHETKLFIMNADDAIAATLACWASYFNRQAMEGRDAAGIGNARPGMGVAIQRMVASDRAGIAFSCDKLTGDANLANIAAAYGGGETAVSGSSDCDFYWVIAATGEIHSKSVKVQNKMLVRNPQGSGYIEVDVPEYKLGAQKLTESEIIEINQQVQLAKDHYGSHRDTEWAIEDGVLWWLQSRPVVLRLPDNFEQEPFPEETAELIVKGLPGAPGVGVGIARICHSPQEANERIRPGDILVIDMTTPDCLPAMIRSNGVIAAIGTPLSHAAIESQSHGIPAAVSATGALEKIEEGRRIVLNGSQGTVYAEDAYATIAWGQRYLEQVALRDAEAAHIETETKIGLISANPELAKAAGESIADMISLLREEGVIESPAIGRHPEAFLAESNPEGFIKPLEDTLEAYCTAFEGKGDVVARTFDAKVDEIINLEDAEPYEEVEVLYRLTPDGEYQRVVRGKIPNYMMGDRGAFRELTRPGLFEMQCEAFLRVWRRHKNLIMMFPFVRTPDELRQLIERAEAYGLKRSEGFRFWMMVEVPSNVILLEEFIDMGLDGISIGSNDLTQLVLGVDRENGKLRPYYTEKDAAVQKAIRDILRRAKAHGCRNRSLCGMMANDHPETVNMLVEEEITSFGVMPHNIGKTRKLVAEAEARRAGMTFDEYQEYLRVKRGSAQLAAH